MDMRKNQQIPIVPAEIAGACRGTPMPTVEALEAYWARPWSGRARRHLLTRLATLLRVHGLDVAGIVQ